MAKSETTTVQETLPHEGIVQLISSPQGELNVLTTSGRMFKRVVDKSRMNQPGTWWTWEEIEGPKL